MSNLLMISGKGAVETARGKHNAFYNTLEELHRYFDRIDVVSPIHATLFENVVFGPFDERRSYDVMTVHEYAPFQNGRLARRMYKKNPIPMIFEIMHIPGMPKAGSMKERIAQLMTRAYIKHDVSNAAGIRVINKQVGAWLEARGIAKEKIHVVSAMYIDLDIFKPMQVEKKYDAIYVGRRAKNKGIELFEAATRGLRTLIVDGWAADAREIALLMNQSMMLVMPSYNEGGPRVVLEALACGIPVLATQVGIVPEVIAREHIIDWSAQEVRHKIETVLKGEIPFMKPDMTRFEKKAAIKAYATFINHYAKRGS